MMTIWNENFANMISRHNALTTRQRPPWTDCSERSKPGQIEIGRIRTLPTSVGVCVRGLRTSCKTVTE